MARYTGYAARAPAVAIAAFVRESGAVYSSEILSRFMISPSSLRRRRPALRALGIVFVENGAGSYYATEALARQLPAASASTTEPLRTTTEPLPTKNAGVSTRTS
jgi:hypothetical protein